MFVSAKQPFLIPIKYLNIDKLCCGGLVKHLICSTTCHSSTPTNNTLSKPVELNASTIRRGLIKYSLNRYRLYACFMPWSTPRSADSSGGEFISIGHSTAVTSTPVYNSATIAEFNQLLLSIKHIAVQIVGQQVCNYPTFNSPVCLMLTLCRRLSILLIKNS